MENENECKHHECKCKTLKHIFKCLMFLLVLGTFLLSLSTAVTTRKIAQNAGVLTAQNESGAKLIISKKYDNRGLTLERAIKSKKPVIAFFYVDWCGYCQRFAPTFHKLTKDREMKKDFAFAYVNCEDTKNQNLVAEYNISAFPTVFLIKDGEKTQIDNGLLFEDYESLKAGLKK